VFLSYLNAKDTEKHMISEWSHDHAKTLISEKQCIAWADMGYYGQEMKSNDLIP